MHILLNTYMVPPQNDHQQSVYTDIWLAGCRSLVHSGNSYIYSHLHSKGLGSVWFAVVSHNQFCVVCTYVGKKALKVLCKFDFLYFGIKCYQIIYFAFFLFLYVTLHVTADKWLQEMVCSYVILSYCNLLQRTFCLRVEMSMLIHANCQITSLSCQRNTPLPPQKKIIKSQDFHIIHTSLYIQLFD